MKLFTGKFKFALLLVALSLVAFVPEAMAGTGGTEFDDIYTLMVGWSQGTLGKVTALGTFIVGLVMGIVNQSIIAVVIGIGSALSMYYGPTVINGVVSALV